MQVSSLRTVIIKRESSRRCHLLTFFSEYWKLFFF